jgi:hypothetical protein
MIITLFEAISSRLRHVVIVDGKYYYQRPCERTEGKPEPKCAINLVDIWNANIDAISKQRPFIPPAVYIAFDPVQWQPLQRGAKAADVTVRLYLMTSTLATTNSQYRMAALDRFHLIRTIERAFVGFSYPCDERGIQCSTFKPAFTVVNHNHDQIIVDEIDFVTHVIDSSAVIDDRKIMTPHNVTLDDDSALFDNAFDDSYS